MANPTNNKRWTLRDELSQYDETLTRANSTLLCYQVLSMAHLPEPEIPVNFDGWEEN
jgi:hypothetical protein